MDTTNNLENEKIPVNEEKTDNIPQSETDSGRKEQDLNERVNTDNYEARTEAAALPLETGGSIETEPTENSVQKNVDEENPSPEESAPIESTGDEITPEEATPETGAEENAPLEVSPEEVIPQKAAPDEIVSEETAPAETVSEETASLEITPEEITPEEVAPEEAVSEGVILEEVVPGEIIPEEVVSEDIVSEEVVPEKSDSSVGLDDAETDHPEAADDDDSPSIDYDLEDATEEDEEEEDTEEDNHEIKPGDLDAVLAPIEDIVQRLRELYASEKLKRKDIEEYKNQFYRSLRDEIEKQKQAFLAEGGEEIDFIANEPAIYAEGKEFLQKIKEKRAELVAKEEAQKEQNVIRKLAIIDQIKALTELQRQEDFNKTYQEFKSLQQEWSDIKLVPQAKVNELWKSYQRYVEKFYDLVRINNEFREYDFKKNLEMKTELCEAAERLDQEPDIVSAFHQLQNLHQEWREIGPVSRKERESIWNRFKEASTLINKKYQSHFESLKEQEDKNLELKTALCEELEAIDYSQIKTIKDWNNKVKEVLEIQSRWRQIGYVPRKWNSKIYKRYRAACDFFFRSKNEFYKSLREEMEENLRKKIALCERAEELKDSTDWKTTTREMIDIQKEWKTIGIVPRKHVDSIWKRFIAACDYFFDQKKMHTSSRYEEENRNLEAKKAIVESIKQLDASLSAEDALPVLRELMDEWHSIGHVPYRLKDRAYREFHEASEAQFDRLNIDRADRKLESFKTNISDLARTGNSQNQLLREREKLMRQYDRMKNELQTYENNIGFLSVASKKGNHLLDDMNQKMERIKSELELIIRKVEAVDKEL